MNSFSKLPRPTDAFSRFLCVCLGVICIQLLANVHFQVTLGSDQNGYSAGIISFEYNEPTPLLFSRAGLYVSKYLNHGAKRLIFEDENGRLKQWFEDRRGWGYIDLADGSMELNPQRDYAPRRLTMHSCVVDLVDIEGGYELRCYHPHQQPDSEEPLPPIEGEPFRVWRIRNSSAEPNDFTHGEITEIVGGEVKAVTNYEFDPENGDCTHIRGSGDNIVRETVGARPQENGDILRFRSYADGKGKITLYLANLCRTFPWGEEILEERVGLENPQVTRYEYYDDKERDGNAYGRKKLVVKPDGSWTRYAAFDYTGYPTKEITPWGNTPPDAPEEQCKVVETINARDFPQKTEIVRIAGMEVSRTYSGERQTKRYREKHTIQAAAPGAAWDAPGNLHTLTKTLYTIDTPFFGTEVLVLRPDGTGLVRTITKHGDQYTMTTLEGKIRNPWPAYKRVVVAGTRTIEIYNSRGNVLSREVYDLASGLQFRGKSFAYDEFWRDVTPPEYDEPPVQTTYDYAHRVANRTVDGLTTSFSYDEVGHTTGETLTGAQGETLTTRYEYNEYGERSAVVSPGGARTEYHTKVLDGQRAETTVLPGGATQVEVYNRDGSLAAVGGSASRPIRYEYRIVDGQHVDRTIWPSLDGTPDRWMETTRDFLGRTICVAYSDNTVSRREYDEAGKLASTTSPDGRTTLYRYDLPPYDWVEAIDMDKDGEIDFDGPDLVEAGRADYVEEDGKVMRRVRRWRWLDDGSAEPTLVSQSRYAADQSRTIHESIGSTIREENERPGDGVVISTVTTDDLRPQVSKSRYGRLLHQEAQEGRTSLYAYDQFARDIGQTDQADGSTMQLSRKLDDDGRVLSISQRVGEETRTVEFEYDEAGNTIAERGPDGSVVRREYDSRHNLTLEYGDTPRTAYQYDRQDRLVAMTTWRDAAGTGEGETTRWEYDERDNLARVVHPDGTHTDYRHDVSGRLLASTSARGVTRSLEYDALGRTVGVAYSDGTSSVAISYNRAGRMVSVTGAAGTTNFQYDDDGNCIAETIPQLPGYMLRRTFDSHRRCTGVTLGTDDRVDFAASYSIDEAGRLAAIVSGENEVRFAHRAKGGVAEITWLRGGTAVATCRTAYDGWGNVAAIAFGRGEGLQAIRYQYDQMDRRVRTELPDGTTWHFDYDRRSQLVAAERRDASGAPLPGENFRFEYDEAGERLPAPPPADFDPDGNLLALDGWTLTWNGADQLAAAAKGDLRLEFAYDHQGRRFEKKVYRSQQLVACRRWVYDGYRMIAEYDALEDEVRLVSTLLWGDGPLLRNGCEFLVTDAAANVVALLDATGKVTDTYRYAPLGMSAHEGSSDNPYRFASKYFDEETSLLYSAGEYYSPTQGRWLRRLSAPSGGEFLHLRRDFPEEFGL